MQKKSVNIKLWCASGVLVLLSFISGYYTGLQKEIEFQSANNNQTFSRSTPAKPSAITRNSSTYGRSNFSETGNGTPKGDEHSLSLPEALISKHWPPPSFNYTTGLFEISSLMSYGLKAESAKTLQFQIAGIIEEIKQEESQNAKLSSDAEGGQFFSIKPFPTVGLALKEKLINFIDAAFDIKDDRSKLLLLGISKHSAFSNFGTDKMEVAIEETLSPDGIKVISYVVKSYQQNGLITTNKSLPASLKYVAERFKLLSNKFHINN